MPAADGSGRRQRLRDVPDLPLTMTISAEQYPLILPPPVEGMNIDLADPGVANDLVVFTVAGLTGSDEDGEPDPRILLGLGGVFSQLKGLREDC